MSQFRTLSAVEQVVEHLRKELYRGAWHGTMPGGDRLAKELAIGRNTVEVALQQLEKEGLLVGQGVRRRRLIKLPANRVVHAPKNLTDLGGNTQRLARMIKETEAEAWVVIAGSEEVLQCFVQRQVPAFALFGLQSQLRIAGIAPDQRPAIVAATRRLINPLSPPRMMLSTTSPKKQIPSSQ